MATKDALNALKKLTSHFQIVIARPFHDQYAMASDYGGSEDNINSPVSFYDMDDEGSSLHGTLRSVTSNYSTVMTAIIVIITTTTIAMVVRELVVVLFVCDCTALVMMTMMMGFR